jgi:hypothetical protein
MSPQTTLDQPGTYRIRVQGKLDASWMDYFYSKEFAYETGADGTITTVMTGTLVDQAQVHGELQKLYSLGLYLLSFEKIEDQGAADE